MNISSTSLSTASTLLKSATNCCGTPIHVEGEQTAVLASDITSEALQLSLVKIPGRTVTFYEGRDVGHERFDAVGIKVVCT